MYEQNKSPAADNEVPFYCAYNLPAVLITCGPAKWEKLRNLYISLTKDSRWKVRRTLAFSLHEVSKIVGPEIAEDELYSILFDFMKDVPDVREGVSVNLPKFIETLKPEQRESFVEKITEKNS